MCLYCLWIRNWCISWSGLISFDAIFDQNLKKMHQFMISSQLYSWSCLMIFFIRGYRKFSLEMYYQIVCKLKSTKRATKALFFFDFLEHFHRFIKWLQEYKCLEPSNIHMMGHSLGAQICGYTGKLVPGIQRITGESQAVFGGDYDLQISKYFNNG